MALLPRALRPSVMIRRKAMYNGFLGPSTFWKVIGVAVFGKSTIKKFFGKNVEVIDVSRLGAGREMQIATSKPMSRRSRKKMVRSGVTPPTLKGDRALGQLWAESKSRRAS
jgi:hypothetical protein